MSYLQRPQEKYIPNPSFFSQFGISQVRGKEKYTSSRFHLYISINFSPPKHKNVCHCDWKVRVG